MSYKTVIHTNLFLICFDKKLLKNHVKSVYKAYTWWLQGCLWVNSVTTVTWEVFVSPLYCLYAIGSLHLWDSGDPQVVAIALSNQSRCCR